MKNKNNNQVKDLERILRIASVLFDEIISYENKYKVNSRDWKSMEKHMVLGVQRIHRIYTAKKCKEIDDNEV